MRFAVCELSCRRTRKTGQYTLRLISGRKVNWSHVGSIPTCPIRASGAAGAQFSYKEKVVGSIPTLPISE